VVGLSLPGGSRRTRARASHRPSGAKVVRAAVSVGQRDGDECNSDVDLLLLVALALGREPVWHNLVGHGESTLLQVEASHDGGITRRSRAADPRRNVTEAPHAIRPCDVCADREPFVNRW